MYLKIAFKKILIKKLNLKSKKRKISEILKIRDIDLEMDFLQKNMLMRTLNIIT
jgi:hypothetical protein